MKKFLKRLSLFLFLLITVCFISDLVISNTLKKSYAYSGELEVMKDIYNGNAECDIAIYGSSRACRHINPRILKDTLNKSVYNFGVIGHHFWIQYLRHLELIKYNKSPQQILFSLDSHSLSQRSNLYNPKQFLPYMLWNFNYYKYTSSYEGYSFLDYYIPLIRYMGENEVLEECFYIITRDSNEKPYRELGFKSINKSWSSDFKNAKAENNSISIKLNEKFKNMFEQFIKECIDLKVDLILIYTPVYIKGQHYVSNQDIILNYYQTLANRHNITFLDYSTDAICLDKRYFFNATHLNKEGANMFSQKLAKDLKAIAIANK